jgi:hypothetical protein
MRRVLRETLVPLAPRQPLLQWALERLSLNLRALLGATPRRQRLALA